MDIERRNMQSNVSSISGGFMHLHRNLVRLMHIGTAVEADKISAVDVRCTALPVATILHSSVSDVIIHYTLSSSYTPSAL